MNEVFAFLKECGAFFIITDNNGAPAGRPFNSMIADGNDLIIGVSNAKDIYRQLKANSRIQIVSLNAGNKWIRANGFALEEFDSYDLKERLYNEDNYVKTHFASPNDERLCIFRVDVLDYHIYE
jgi:uncharacterized pyridoxamine 5'-phosphate oxidase family protein